MSGTLKLPRPPAQYDRDDQASMRGALELADAQTVKRGVAIDALYLIATDTGATMKLTVTSAGVETWTQVARS